MKGKNSDFQEFLNSKGTLPPKKLDQVILSRVKGDLSPKVSFVFSKLLTIQGAVGLVSLLFCPQFQVSFGSDYTLIHSMSQTFGPLGCMAICGAIFLGSGAIISGVVLNRIERRLVRDTKYLMYFFLIGASLLLFSLCGGELYVEITMAWTIGAILSSIIGIELSGKIRDKFALA